MEVLHSGIILVAAALVLEETGQLAERLELCDRQPPAPEFGIEEVKLVQGVFKAVCYNLSYPPEINLFASAKFHQLKAYMTIDLTECHALATTDLTLNGHLKGGVR